MIILKEAHGKITCMLMQCASALSSHSSSNDNKQELNFFFSFNIKINKRTDKATYIINIALWDEQTDIETHVQRRGVKLIPDFEYEDKICNKPSL